MVAREYVQYRSIVYDALETASVGLRLWLTIFSDMAVSLVKMNKRLPESFVFTSDIVKAFEAYEEG